MFTLGSALGWLGHRCPRECSAPIDELSASLWFTRHGSTLRAAPRGTVVVVDVTERDDSDLEVRDLIRTVNACAGMDGIAVRAGRGT